MKLDKFGKKWAKIIGVIFMACSAFLIGGLHNPWVPDAPVEGKIWITAIFLMITMSSMALAFLTEAKEKSINPNETRSKEGT